MQLDTKMYSRITIDLYLAAEFPESGEMVLNGRKETFNKGDYLAQHKITGVQKIYTKETFESWFTLIKEATYVVKKDPPIIDDTNEAKTTIEDHETKLL